MPELIASNDKLALLSLSAAYEIDLRLDGENVGDRTVLRELGERLAKVSGSSSEPSTAFLHADPSTTEVFAKAVEEASDTAITDIAELAAQMKKIIEPITGQGHRPSRDELSLVKSFCLALHRSMMAQAMPPLADWDVVDGDINFA